MTLADLLARFRREGNPPRSRKPAHWWDRWRADTGRIPLAYLARGAAALRRVDILALRDAVTAEGYAPASAGMTVLGISAAYQWAIEQELLQHNPCKGVPTGRCASPPRRCAPTTTSSRPASACTSPPASLQSRAGAFAGTPKTTASLVGKSSTRKRSIAAALQIAY